MFGSINILYIFAVPNIHIMQNQYCNKKSIIKDLVLRRWQFQKWLQRYMYDVEHLNGGFLFIPNIHNYAKKKIVLH